MKLFTAIASAAVIGASFLVLNPVEARNGWVMTTDKHRYRVYDKFISRSGNIVTHDHRHVENDGKSTGYLTQTDCSAWAKRAKFDFGWVGWSEILPETTADYSARAMCR